MLQKEDSQGLIVSYSEYNFFFLLILTTVNLRIQLGIGTVCTIYYLDVYRYGSVMAPVHTIHLLLDLRPSPYMVWCAVLVLLYLWHSLTETPLLQPKQKTITILNDLDFVLVILHFIMWMGSIALSIIMYHLINMCKSSIVALVGGILLATWTFE